MCGTPNYIAPEVLHKQGHSTASEVNIFRKYHVLSIIPVPSNYREVHICNIDVGRMQEKSPKKYGVLGFLELYK